MNCEGTTWYASVSDCDHLSWRGLCQETVVHELWRDYRYASVSDCDLLSWQLHSGDCSTWTVKGPPDMLVSLIVILSWRGPCNAGCVLDSAHSWLSAGDATVYMHWWCRSVNWQQSCSSEKRIDGVAEEKGSIQMMPIVTTFFQLHFSKDL